MRKLMMQIFSRLASAYHLIQRKLDSLDEMESDCIFETTVQWVRNEKTVKGKHAIAISETNMSWKRMRERSSARELSAMSTAASILSDGG